MASAADSLASGLNLSKFAQATDLKKRLWFTIGALIVFRLLSFVPLPGRRSDRARPAARHRRTGGVLDFFNNFSGGSLKRMSLTALGVMPYITASIVVQLATSLSPTLAAIKKEGESGRKRLNQYTRYGTVGLTAIQGYFIAVGLESFGATQGIQAVVEPGMMFRAGAVISLIGGTMFLMWLGEQITSRGIGNGVSLIIMAGIVAQLPTNIYNLVNGSRTGSMDSFQLIGIIVGGRRHRPAHLLHGARAAPHPDPISQAPDRARRAGRAQPFAAQAQHRGRDPADLRLVAAADAADDHAVRRQQGRGRQLVGRRRHHAQPVSAARHARCT